MHVALPLALLAMAVAQVDGEGATVAGAAQTEQAWILRDVIAETAPIFGPERSEGRPLRQLADATHWTTAESVVRREIWKRPGDVVTEAFAAELERNLRATGLFASAVVTLVPDGDECDLVVKTRDRLSISGGASGSFVGDIASGGFSLSENNLFGTGDRLSFGFNENDLGEFRGSAAYRDRYLLGSWTTGSVRVGRTDDGPFSALSVNRPFRYLEDTFAWSLAAADSDADRDYFADDENVAEVPFSEQAVNASATWRRGSAMRFATGGLVLRHSDLAYGAARGVAAASVRVPGDTTSTFAGVTLGARNIRSFEKVTGLDTLRFVQDLELSSAASLELGGTLRDEDGAGGSELQPTAGLSLSERRMLSSDAFVSGSIEAAGRFEGGEAVGWAATADVSAFLLSLRPHTLAINARLTEANETQDLPVQLVLGEGRGLRGYPRDQFTGQRVLSVSLEDRIDLGVSLGAFDFGAAVFADLGWITNRGEDLGRPLTSAGVGLRIGSNELLGRGVLRVDLSFPLDEVNGERLDPLVSLTLGQTFGFTGR